MPKKQNKKEIEEEVETLTSKIGLDKKQVDKITSLPSYKWAIDEYKNVESKIALLEKQIDENQSIISNEKKLKDVYKQELMDLRKSTLVK